MSEREVNAVREWLSESLPNREAALEAALWVEWLGNHAEHCRKEWPHPDVVEGIPCCYPLPAVLAATPSVCPTCGSADPRLRYGVPALGKLGDGKFGCNDTFHSVPSEETPPCPT